MLSYMVPVLFLLLCVGVCVVVCLLVMSVAFRRRDKFTLCSHIYRVIFSLRGFTLWYKTDKALPNLPVLLFSSLFS